jgi:lipopolysaccharide export system protein LptA
MSAAPASIAAGGPFLGTWRLLALRLAARLVAGPALLALFLALAWPGGVAPAAAQEAGAAAASGGGFGLDNEDEPIEISAENGIEWKRDSRTYTARGNALAQQGETSIAADTLIAHLDENDEIESWEAIGNVKIRTKRSTSYGDRAEYQEASRVMILTGNNLKVETDKETVTARDQIEYWRDRDAVVAKGAVVIVREETTIHADEATGYFRDDGQADASGVNDDGGGSDLSQLDAQGHVRVDKKDQTAFSDKLAYNPDTEIAVLTGNVVINSKENRYTGGRAELDLKNDISRLLPASGERVRTLIKKKDKTEDAGGGAAVTQ